MTDADDMPAGEAERDALLRWTAICRALIDADIVGLACLDASEPEMSIITRHIAPIAAITGTDKLRSLLAAFRDEVELGIDDIPWAEVIRDARHDGGPPLP